MTDDQDKPKAETPEAEPKGPRCGERLAEARRDKQISVLEIAKELHIDDMKVRALEANDFEKLGAPVFAKGHLRKYSQLVGIDADDVLADYYRLTRAETLQPVVSTRRLPRSELSLGPWLAVAVILLVIAIIYWLLVTRPFSSDAPRIEPAPTAPAGQELQEESLPDASPDEAPVEDMDEAPGDSEPAIEEAPPEVDEQEPDTVDDPQPVTATPPPERTPAQQGTVSLQITFNGDCWTEISDATGRRLFFNLGQAGRMVTVTGQEPLSVLFGDADNVSLVVNGNEFTIADADRRGRTARFLLFGS
jgi:cytoskeleton protein RodZ